MTQSWSDRCWKLDTAIAIFLVVSGAIASGDSCALAQLQPDTTLGSESSIVNSKVPIKEILIDGGAKRGANLFHSFQEFNIDEGQRVYFTNPSGIENILTRVTGGRLSNILGTLGVLGSANLFLLNPHGITFGSNASLDVNGSFLASTANSLKFANGTQFSATAPQTVPLLTLSVPLGLQYNGTAAGINVQGARLIVKPGTTLALVGGEVTLAGRYLIAPEGRIELGGVAGSGLVSLNSTHKGWILGYENIQNFQNIRLSRQTTVDVSGNDSGDIHVQGKQVRISDGSQMLAANLGLKPGGTLAINASELVELVGTLGDRKVAPSGFFTASVSAGTAGNTIINTGRLVVRNGAIISTESASSGDSGQVVPATGRGGNLTVVASESIELINSRLSSQTRGSANAGNVSIKTGRLLIQGEGAGVSVSSTGKGDAGNIEITARSVRIDNKGFLQGETASGEGGNIALQQVQDLQLRHNSKISTSAGGRGNGGNINVGADTLAILENSRISANAVGGKGGNVRITTQGLFIAPDSKITATSDLGPEFNGLVEIKTPGVDPTKGLFNLQQRGSDRSTLITRGCPTERESGRFVITGRGGLPPSPQEIIESNGVVLPDLGTPVTPVKKRSGAAVTNNTIAPPSVPLVEAQGWIIGGDGKVILVASAPNSTHTPSIKSMECNSLSNKAGNSN